MRLNIQMKSHRNQNISKIVTEYKNIIRHKHHYNAQNNVITLQTNNTRHKTTM